MPDPEAPGEAESGAKLTPAPEADDGHMHERICLNCGTTLQGEYCHACGQKAHVHRTLKAFWHDLAHSALHFEGRIWRTLPRLAWRPGELTRRYIEGKRARFVSPIALFLFSVFLMFAIVSITDAIQRPDSESVEAGIREEVRLQSLEVAELTRQKIRAAAANRPTSEIDERLAEAQLELSAMQAAQSGGISSRAQFSDDVPDWIRAAVEKARKNPDLLFYKLKTNAYKFSWALIPISVPFLWLLFPFSRRFGLYDHLVFVTYSLSFMTLLLVAALLLGAAGAGAVAGFAVFVPPIHMYRQLRGAYELTRAGAAWRAFMLTLFSIAAGIVFVLLLVAVGLFN